MCLRKESIQVADKKLAHTLTVGFCHQIILLFACLLYINDIALEIKEKGGGTQWGGVKVSVSMYADDMILLAESKEGLQKSKDAAFEYRKRWRFLFNVGKDKTEAMIFHGQEQAKRERGKR